MSSSRFRTAWVGIVVMLLAVTLAACGSGGGGEDSSVPRQVQEDGSGFPQEVPADGDVGDDDRMVIRTKVLRFEVANTADALDAVRDLTRTHAGTVSDMKVATNSDEWLYHYDENGRPVGDGSALRGWVTVRVPSANYEGFLDEVADIGTIKYQSEATEDVTQQHVDLSARLENLRAQEARLRDFFDAATNVTEMLAIEEELGRIRGEIESLDAQITYLERQAAMATVSIELTEPADVVSPPGESWGFVAAITDGIRGAATLVTGLLTVLIATSPLWILGLVLFFPVRAVVRRRRAASEERVVATVAAATRIQPHWSVPSPAAADPAAGAEEAVVADESDAEPEDVADHGTSPTQP